MSTPAMLIYLDTCCFNRPFDDQSQTRTRFEIEAKLELQERVRQNKVGLVWSSSRPPPGRNDDHGPMGVPGLELPHDQ